VVELVSSLNFFEIQIVKTMDGCIVCKTRKFTVLSIESFAKQNVLEPWLQPISKFSCMCCDVFVDDGLVFQNHTFESVCGLPSTV
jgi:hypothetical protein